MERRWTTIIVLMGLFLLVPGRGFACPVPVFRYALERWMADSYDAVLIHRGQTDDDPNVSLLRDEIAETLNLRLLEMNLASSTDEQIKGLLGDQVPEKLPALALWYPWQRGRAAPLWVGELTSSTFPALADSPVRQDLAKRLTEGHSAVWILLKSGNAAKDAKVLDLLKQELEEATRQLKETPPLYVDELEVPGLSYEFSILPVSRSDPAEKMLLTMLLNSEPDLNEYKDEPIVFPVFGRGRVLFALVADGINADNIQETIGFLVGPCGCEIKAMNPGVDLLMDAGWDEAIMELYEEFYAVEEPLPELTSVFPEEPAAAPNDITSELAPTQATDANNLTGAGDEQAQAAEVAQRDRRRLGVMGTTAVSLAGILLVVAVGTLAVTRQRKANQ
jgi:hypothetical protein